MKRIVLTAIRVYQLFSVVGISRCRFYPSCSQYTYEAIDHFGIFSGMRMGARRLLKCHPFHTGGYDPVQHPSARKASSTAHPLPCCHGHTRHTKNPAAAAAFMEP
jgi:putative membrane protein insertion efficiency factor